MRKRIRKVIDTLKRVAKTRIFCNVASILILVTSVLISVFRYDTSAVRFADSFVNLKNSFLAVFSRRKRSNKLLLGNSESSYQKVAGMLPYDFEALKHKLETFGERFFNGDVLASYSGEYIRHVILMLLNCIILYSILLALANIFEAIFFNKREKDAHLPTTCLRWFLRYVEIPVGKLIKYLKAFWKAFNSKWYYKLVFYVIWAFNFNLFAIAFEFFSWYFTFPFFASPEGLEVLLIKLILDAALALDSAPWYIWAVIFYRIFKYLRFEKAVSKLQHLFSRVYALVKSFPRAIMFYGTMGAEKTKTMSFWAFVLCVVYRDDAYETMHKVQMQFPDFPFLSFENELKASISSKDVKHLRSARKYVKKLKKSFEDGKHELYGYRERLWYDSGIRYVDIFEQLEMYAQAYYIYTMSSSYMISNYPIRDQSVLSDGYVPKLDKDFFRRSADDYERVSQFSHAADFDIYRLKKRFNMENKEQFEFGISCRQENSKERGNKDSNKKYDELDENVNPLNDGTGLHTRFKRHFATVDYKDYSTELVDDQRTMDLNAYEREPYMHVYIGEKSEKRTTLPFFFVEEFLHSTICSWFSEFYLEVRGYGRENTLIIHLLRKVFSAFDRYYEKAYRNFGYHVTELERTNGLNESEVKRDKLFMIYKIAHGDLYSTDSMRGFTDELMDRTEGGLDSTPTYDSFYPTIEQSLASNSFLVNEMYKLIDKNEQQPKLKFKSRTSSSRTSSSSGKPRITYKKRE